MTHDPVNHPAHYNRGRIEVVDFIEDQKLNFNRGNVVKYVTRAGYKAGDELEDLRKAQFYLKREIRRLSRCTAGAILRRVERRIKKKGG